MDENDLRAALDEHSEHPPDCPNVGEKAARRGRRIIRGRFTAVTAVAAGAVALGVTLPHGLDGGPPQAPVRQPINAATSTASPAPTSAPLPDTFRHVPRIAAYHYDKVGYGARIVFTPKSQHTIYWIRCADPDATVVVYRANGAGGESSGSIGRCGDGSLMQEAINSHPPGWVGQRQSFSVWVFPPNLTIPSRGFLPERAPELAQQVTDQPGAWAVGVYDSPHAQLLQPPGATEPSKQQTPS